MSYVNPVDDYLIQLEGVIHAISREQIWAVVNVLMDAWRGGKHIFLFGNGGSAATASHMANDLNKFATVEGKPRFKAIALSDNVPLMTAWGNDTAYENIFVEQLLNFIEAGDVVIGISASGNTGDKGGKINKIVDHCIFIPSGLIGQQEDGHMILDHVIVLTLKDLIEAEK